MKNDARILKFHGKDLRTAADLTAAMEALMTDIVTGRLTPAEAKRIQKEINARIKPVEAALKTASQFFAFRKLVVAKEKMSPNVRRQSNREGANKKRKGNTMAAVEDDKIVGFHIGSEDVCRECTESEEEESAKLDEIILADDNETDWLFCDRCKSRIK